MTAGVLFTIAALCLAAWFWWSNRRVVVAPRPEPAPNAYVDQVDLEVIRLEHDLNITPLGSDPDHCKECEMVADGMDPVAAKVAATASGDLLVPLMLDTPTLYFERTDEPTPEPAEPPGCAHRNVERVEIAVLCGQRRWVDTCVDCRASFGTGSDVSSWGRP